MNVKYDDIRRANDTIKTVPIEKKDKKTGKIRTTNYAEVNQRIKAFRIVYPDGFIITELSSNENGICIFRATVGHYTDGGEPLTLGVGTAYENENSSYINQTSYIENCETSAVGRALGMAGFGIDVSVASYEEVRNAMLNAEKIEDLPEGEAPTPIPEARTFVCADCGNELTETIGKSGGVIPPAFLASQMTQRFGRVLCADCGRKAAEARKS